MNTVDELIELFEAYEFEKAIIGNEVFFLRCKTWGNHTTLVVFYHLFCWLKINQTSDIIKKIENVFINQSKSPQISEIDSGLKSLGLIRSYCIKAGGQNYWPVSAKFLLKLIEDIKKEFYRPENDQLNVKRDINLLNGYLPELNLI